MKMKCCETGPCTIKLFTTVIYGKFEQNLLEENKTYTATIDVNLALKFGNISVL
jgi:hypothetical protein